LQRGSALFEERNNRFVDRSTIDSLMNIALAIDQLHDADDFPFRVFHRHGEHGLTTIAVLFVEAAIEPERE
jgi:hypothetical protein